MSQIPYPLDPEVEAILQEVAKDPNSVLLRVDRDREVHDLATSEQTVSSRSANWTTAERHLLDCYREEVAFLLRYLYYVGFVNQERVAALRELQPKTAFRGIAQDAGVIRSHVRREGEYLRADHSETRDKNVVEAIEQCIGVGLDEGVSQMKLASASLRLVPNGAARLYVGQEQLFSGDRERALETLSKISAESPKAGERWWADVYSGDALRQEGQYRRALEAFRKTGAAEGPTLDPQIWHLCSAMQFGDDVEFTKASQSLEERCPDESTARVWRSHLTSRAVSEGWLGSLSFQRILTTSIDSTGPLTKVLLDALR